MAGEKDPFRAEEAQAKQQQHEREAAEGQEAQPTTADFEAYDEEVAEKVKGIGGAGAGGPAV
jgi:hypothetical protein